MKNLKPFKKPGHGVALKELAEHLRLSQATVSRALNGHEAISVITRQRVAAAAKELGYSPNPSARRLATGRVNAVGLIFPLERLLLSQTNFFDVITGISELLTLRNYDLVMSPFTSDEEAVYRRLASSRSVDGVIVTRPLVQDPRVPLLHALGLPFVLHGRTEADIPYSFVDVDNEAIFSKATGLLLDLGHRRIAALNAPLETFFASTRARGYRQALEDRGIRFDPTLHHETVMNEESGYKLTRQMLEGAAPPTAIVCGSIFLAIGVYRAIRDVGLEPGRDVSVVAHDDCVREIRATQFQPPLTATESSIRKAGSRTAEILLDHLSEARESDKPVQEIWPVELMFRGSTAPMP
jgi:LacI family transcriptional regulator